MTQQLLSDVNVLIVEDDKLSRELLVRGLKPYCAMVRGASNGLDGLNEFKKQDYDVVLADIHMPIMNGFSMIDEIKKLKNEQKFIIFTSFDTDINLAKSADAGALLFLKKPIDIAQLRRSLITLTHKKSSEMIRLSDEISIDRQFERIYRHDEQIFLSYSQHRLFWLLARNLGQLVSYEMIDEYVYDGAPSSKAAVQNMVLRLKRQLKIRLKNISEMGYVLFPS